MGPAYISIILYGLSLPGMHRLDELSARSAILQSLRHHPFGSEFGPGDTYPFKPNLMLRFMIYNSYSAYQCLTDKWVTAELKLEHIA